MCTGRCPHRPADLPKGSNFLVQPHRNRPAEFARTSLSACGLPTPLVALACIGNVGIQAFSSVCGRLLFLRRLQDKPPLKGEGDQRSWWRDSFPATAANRFHKELRFFFSLLKRKKEAKKEKSSRFPCTTRQCTTRRLHINKNPPAGHTGGCRRRNTTLFTVEIGA